MRVLVTGGAGFIGSHFAKRLLAAGDDVRVLDKLTYSGNPANLEGSGIELLVGDICDADAVAEAAAGCDAIVNFAAETHVDRSILGPAEFIQTNVAGTQVLLDHVRDAGIRLVCVSTDEVYGDVPEGVSSVEDDPLRPSSRTRPRRPAATCRCSAWSNSARRGRGDHAWLEHVRAEPVPGEAVATLRHECSRRRAVAHVRRRQADARLLFVETTPPDASLRPAAAAPARSTTSAAARRRPTARSSTSCWRTPAPTRRSCAGSRTGRVTTAATRSTRRRRARIRWEPRTRLAQGFPLTATWYAEHRTWWEPIKSSGGYREYYEKQYADRLASSS